MKLTQITNPVALRLDTTVGTRIFAGNTMIHGDTGWRNITDSVINEWGTSVYPIRLIRIGKTVEVKGYLNKRDTATSNVALVVPTGFRPRSTMVAGVAVGDSSLMATGMLVDLAGNIHVNRSVDINQHSVYFHCIYTTGDSWPTTLPGLPG